MGEITCPFPYFKGCTVNFWEWITQRTHNTIITSLWRRSDVFLTFCNYCAVWPLGSNFTHTLLGMWLLSILGLKLIHISKRGPDTWFHNVNPGSVGSCKYCKNIMILSIEIRAKGVTYPQKLNTTFWSPAKISTGSFQHTMHATECLNTVYLITTLIVLMNGKKVVILKIDTTIFYTHAIYYCIKRLEIT